MNITTDFKFKPVFCASKSAYNRIVSAIEEIEDAGNLSCRYPENLSFLTSNLPGGLKFEIEERYANSSWKDLCAILSDSLMQEAFKLKKENISPSERKEIITARIADYHNALVYMKRKCRGDYDTFGIHGFYRSVGFANRHLNNPRIAKLPEFFEKNEIVDVKTLEIIKPAI